MNVFRLDQDIRVQARPQPASGSGQAAWNNYLQGRIWFSNYFSHYLTIFVQEYSSDVGDPYYPVPNPRNQELYSKYQKLATEEKGVTFVGRLASYKYFNMDQAILNALELFDKLKEDGKVASKKKP